MMRPDLEYCVQFWASQQQRSGHTGKSPTNAHQDDHGSGPLLLWEKAERTGTGEEEAQGGLLNIHNCLKGGCQVTETRLCSIVLSARTRGHGHNRFPLTTRSSSVLCGLWSADTGFPETVGSPWGSSKAAWTWPWISVLEHSWARLPPEVLSSLSHCVILWNVLKYYDQSSMDVSLHTELHRRSTSGKNKRPSGLIWDWRMMDAAL